MKVRYAIPMALAMVAWTVCQVRAEERGAGGGLNINTPRANVDVQAGRGATNSGEANINAQTPRANVDVQAGQGATYSRDANINRQTPRDGVNVESRGNAAMRDSRSPTAPSLIPTPDSGVQRNGNGTLFTDNRPDQWRYRNENNRWWYYAPDNRWMWYSEPNGWTYYDPSGSYTTGYGGVTVTPDVQYQATPAPTYYYPNSGYYYPNGYYYGRPGVYLGGRGWGVRVGGWGRRW